MSTFPAVSREDCAAGYSAFGTDEKLMSTSGYSSSKAALIASNASSDASALETRISRTPDGSWSSVPPGRLSAGVPFDAHPVRSASVATAHTARVVLRLWPRNIVVAIALAPAPVSYTHLTLPTNREV